MINNSKNWVVIGKFGRPQGLTGFVRVFSFTDPKDNIFDYINWHAKINHVIQEIKPVTLQKNNKFDLVKIAGFESREQAAALTNIEIVIEESQLPTLPENEYYWHELIGMNVQNDQGINLGAVKEMLETGANDVVVVEGEKRYLIPYICDDFILNVDSNNKLITVNWDPEF